MYRENWATWISLADKDKFPSSSAVSGAPFQCYWVGGRSKHITISNCQPPAQQQKTTNNTQQTTTNNKTIRRTTTKQYEEQQQQQQQQQEQQQQQCMNNTSINPSFQVNKVRLLQFHHSDNHTSGTKFVTFPRENVWKKKPWDGAGGPLRINTPYIYP